VSLEPRWQQHLRQAMAYLTCDGGCRRAVLARHFGEPPPPCNAMCDLCLKEPGKAGRRTVDITGKGQAVLRTLQAQHAAQKKCTLIQLVDRWRSSRIAEDAKLAKSISRQEAEAVVAELMYASYLDFEFGYTAYATTAYLVCSRTAALLLNGTRRLEVPAERLAGSTCEVASPAAAPGNRSPVGDAADEKVRVALDRLRRTLAAENNLFPESVLPPWAMSRLCEERPAERSRAMELLEGSAALQWAQDVAKALRGMDRSACSAQTEGRGQKRGRKHLEAQPP